MKKGFAQIILIFIITIVATLIVMAWQSRLLLGVHRMQSLVDLLKTTYGAESSINDTMARFLGDVYPLPVSGTETLADGTILEVNENTLGNIQTFSVKAKREFSTTNIVLTKEVKKDKNEAIKDIEIMLITDCTGSMSDPSNQTCLNLCDQYWKYEDKNLYKQCIANNGCTTRMHEQKRAMLEFLDRASEFQVDNPSITLKIGWSGYTVDAKVINDLSDNLTSLRSDVEAGLSDIKWESPACNFSDEYTSIGSGFDMVNKYFDDRLSNPTKKRVEVLISDGEPNSRYTSYTGKCPAPVGLQTCVDSQCQNGEPITFLQCSVKKDSDGGSMPDDIEPYSVIVSDSSKIPQQVHDILEANTTYLNPDDATDLSRILVDYFEQITSSVTLFEIERVIPTPN